MNSYEYFGRLVVSVGASAAIFGIALGTWLGMMGDVWKWGPFAK